MNSKINQLLIDLNEQLKFINLEIENSIKRCEKAIEIISKALDSLKKNILKSNFKSQIEEIKFFKEIKPQFFSKLIFYSKVLKIETKRPKGKDSTKRKYLLNELDNINRYFDDNLEFHQYYRL